MATFGDTTAGTTTAPCSSDRAWLSKFAPSTSGTVTQINCRFDSTSTAGTTFKALIYTDNAGVPGTLLGVGAATVIPAGGGDLASTGLSVAITAATNYWLGFVTDDFHAVAQADTSGGGSRSEAAEGMSFTSPPTTYVESGTTGGQFNVYATYTEGVSNSVFYLRA